MNQRAEAHTHTHTHTCIHTFHTHARAGGQWGVLAVQRAHGRVHVHLRPARVRIPARHRPPGALRCVWRGVAWCGVMCCGGVGWCVWSGVGWCVAVCCVVWGGALRCVWRGALRCVAWCGVVWCGVVHCGVCVMLRVLLHQGCPGRHKVPCTLASCMRGCLYVLLHPRCTLACPSVRLCALSVPACSLLVVRNCCSMKALYHTQNRGQASSQGEAGLLAGTHVHTHACSAHAQRPLRTPHTPAPYATD